MSLEEITNALEVLSVDFAKLTHLVQKFAENEMAKNNTHSPAFPTFKIIVVGDGGVGKSTFIWRHLTGNFEENYVPTLGVNVDPLRFNTNYGPVCLNIWNCAGQDQYGGLRDGYYIQAHAAIVMYDVSNLETFNNLDKWITSIRKMNPDLPIVVVGNKVDASGFGGMRDTVWNKDLQHYYVSAKSNYNFVEPFKYLLQVLMKRNDLQIK